MALCISPRGHTQEMKKVLKVEGTECWKLVTQGLEEQRNQQGPERLPARPGVG